MAYYTDYMTISVQEFFNRVWHHCITNRHPTHNARIPGATKAGSRSLQSLAGLENRLPYYGATVASQRHVSLGKGSLGLYVSAVLEIQNDLEQKERRGNSLQWLKLRLLAFAEKHKLAVPERGLGARWVDVRPSFRRWMNNLGPRSSATYPHVRVMQRGGAASSVPGMTSAPFESD